jgi:hypothetical protein
MIDSQTITAVDLAPVAARRKKAQRGGYRPGAGRKRVLQGARAVTVTLEEPQYEAVEEFAATDGVSLASIVRKAIDAYLSRRGR